MNFTDSITKAFLTGNGGFIPRGPAVVDRWAEYEDPTYMGFYFRFLPNTIVDNTNTDLDYFPQGLFLGAEGYRPPLPAGYGGDVKNIEHPDSAVSYLERRNEFYRADMIREFREGMMKMTKDCPWVFEKVTGMSDLWKFDPKINFRAKEKRIIFDCTESINARMTYLIDLYRKAAFDTEYMRHMLPENQRYFSMELIVTEIRNMQLSDDITNYDFETATFLGFTLEYCEFDFYNDSLTYLENLMTYAGDSARVKIPIKIGKITEVNRYGLLGAVLSDTFGTSYRGKEQSKKSFSSLTKALNTADRVALIELIGEVRGRKRYETEIGYFLTERLGLEFNLNIEFEDLPALLDELTNIEFEFPDIIPDNLASITLDAPPAPAPLPPVTLATPGLLGNLATGIISELTNSLRTASTGVFLGNVYGLSLADLIGQLSSVVNNPVAAAQQILANFVSADAIAAGALGNVSLSGAQIELVKNLLGKAEEALAAVAGTPLESASIADLVGDQNEMIKNTKFSQNLEGNPGKTPLDGISNTSLAGNPGKATLDNNGAVLDGNPGNTKLEDNGAVIDGNPGKATFDNNGAVIDGNPGKATFDNNGGVIDGNPGSTQLDSNGAVIDGNPGSTELEDNGAVIDGNPGSTQLDSNGAVIDGNPGKTQLDSNGAVIDGNPGEVKLDSNGAVIDGNPGKTKFDNNGAVIDGKPGSTELIDNGAVLIGRPGSTKLEDNGAVIDGNPGKTQLEDNGAVIDGNPGKTRLEDNGAVIDGSPGATKLEGPNLKLEGSPGKVTLEGSSIKLEGNPGSTELEGNGAEIEGNPGKVSLLTGNIKLEGNPGKNELTGSEANIEGNPGSTKLDSPNVELEGNPGTVIFNSANVKLEGDPGTAQLSTGGGALEGNPGKSELEGTSVNIEGSLETIKLDSPSVSIEGEQGKISFNTSNVRLEGSLEAAELDSPNVKLEGSLGKENFDESTVKLEGKLGAVSFSDSDFKAELEGKPGAITFNDSTGKIEGSPGNINFSSNNIKLEGNPGKTVLKGAATKKESKPGNAKLQSTNTKIEGNLGKTKFVAGSIMSTPLGKIMFGNNGSTLGGGSLGNVSFSAPSTNDNNTPGKSDMKSVPTIASENSLGSIGFESTNQISQEKPENIGFEIPNKDIVEPGRVEFEEPTKQTEMGMKNIGLEGVATDATLESIKAKPAYKTVIGSAQSNINLNKSDDNESSVLR